MLFRFNKFINEEIRIEKMDEPTLISLKKNLMFRLGEYRTYILANIEYNFTTNKVEYKKFILAAAKSRKDLTIVQFLIRRISGIFKILNPAFKLHLIN